MRGRSRITRTSALAIMLLSIGFPRVALADARAQAELLFQQGKAAMARKEYTKACDLFADSLKLEDTTGTLLNLAVCHEEVGKVATAWGEFESVQQRALRADPPQTERATFAHEHSLQLKPRLSFVKITVAPEANVPGLEVAIDDVVEPRALWDAGVPVDPGTRKVSANAPGKKAWIGSVRVDDEKVTISTNIPLLADLPKVAPPKQGVDVMDLEAIANARARRTAGFIVGGFGLAGAISMGIFAGLALSSKSAETNDCSKNDCYKATSQASASPSYLAASNDHANADTYANVANVSAGLALVGVGIGAYLIFTANPTPKKTAHVDFAPALSKDSAGFAAFGAF